MHEFQIYTMIAVGFLSLLLWLAVVLKDRKHLEGLYERTSAKKEQEVRKNQEYYRQIKLWKSTCLDLAYNRIELELPHVGIWNHNQYESDDRTDFEFMSRLVKRANEERRKKLPAITVQLDAESKK